MKRINKQTVLSVALGASLGYATGLVGMDYAGSELGCCMNDCCGPTAESDRIALRSAGMLYRLENDNACPTTHALVAQRYIAAGPWQDDYVFHCDEQTIWVEGLDQPYPPTPRDTWCPRVRGWLTRWLLPFRLFA